MGGVEGGGCGEAGVGRVGRGLPWWLRYGKIPWRREWLPTPVFLPGEFHGQRSLVGYSPLGRKELGTLEHFLLNTDHIFLFAH